MPSKAEYDADPERYRAAAREYYRIHRAERLEYQKSYESQHREESTLRVDNWRLSNRERFLAQHKRHMAEQRERNPEKVKARQLAKHISTEGKTCELCGSTQNLERHHSDYSKPLDVKILCMKCHKSLHQESD